MSLVEVSEFAFSCKDCSVSQENFDLYWNADKTILITHPQPKAEKLAGYYDSKAYISHTDASQTWMDKLYQQVKKYMLKRKLRLISNLASHNKNLLDIGAGTGDFLAMAKQHNWTVSGVEPNQKARSLAAEKNLILQNDVKAFADKKFDIITLWHVLEHLPDLENQIITIKKLLTKNGNLIIAVPNFKSYDAKYYQESWAAYDVPRHLWHFSPEGIESLFSHFGLELIQTKPLTFDSYYVSLLSEKYKNGKMNPLKAFGVGFKSNRKAKKTNQYSSLIYIFKEKAI